MSESSPRRVTPWPGTSEAASSLCRAKVNWISLPPIPAQLPALVEQCAGDPAKQQDDRIGDDSWKEAEETRMIDLLHATALSSSSAPRQCGQDSDCAVRLLNEEGKT